MIMKLDLRTGKYIYKMNTIEYHSLRKREILVEIS